MIRKLIGKCPICANEFTLEIDEEKITSADYFPVVFSTIHCNQALICYVDANFTIRMIETAFLPQNVSSNKDNQAELITKDGLSQEKRTILESTIDKSKLNTIKFPNIVEKQIFYQIYKNQNLSLENLLEKLKMMESALNIEITLEFLTPLVDKYVKQGIIRRTVI